MVRALAIETSGRVGSVAVVVDGQVLAEETVSHGLKHAAQLVPIIDALCRGQSWTPGDLHEVYVSVGPGSFTGLRVGVTVAKTLAFAIGVKLVAVPTVEALARNAPPEARHMIIVLDAKREQIFTARLSRSDAAADWIVTEPARVDSLSAMLSRSPRPVHLIGEGIPYHAGFIPSDDAGIIVTPPERWIARCSEVSTIGWAMRSRSEYADPDRLAPLYIRKPEAQEKLEATLAVKQ